MVSDGGQKLFREPDLIDVWFDSGAMPYAQWGLDYDKLEKGEALPFKDEYFSAFPADFIAEGVDQTRGWFFTLHAISTMVRGSIAFKNVVSNGLVLDKNGNKMSKRLGNGVDPFATIDKYSADATRWYMISNAAPWDNLKPWALIEKRLRLAAQADFAMAFYNPRRPAPDQIENEVPQPQDELALGLSMVKRDPISSSA